MTTLCVSSLAIPVFSFFFLSLAVSRLAWFLDLFIFTLVLGSFELNLFEVTHPVLRSRPTP